MWGGAIIGTALPTIGQWSTLSQYNPATSGNHTIGVAADFIRADKKYFVNTGVLLLSSNASSFLQVPLTVNVFFGNTIKGYLILGFYNTFLLQAPREKYKSHDFGLNYGLGMEYKFLPSMKFFAEYRLYYGLIPFEKLDSPYYTEYYSMDYAFLQAGVKFLLKAKRID